MRRQPKRQPGEAVQRDVGQRWTPRLADGGWTPIATAFLQYYSGLGITALEAMFVCHLISFKWDAKHPYPSFRVLARLMGVTDSTVRGYARSLDRKGYLNRLNQSGERNQFDLSPLFEALERAMPEPKSRRHRDRPAPVLDILAGRIVEPEEEEEEEEPFPPPPQREVKKLRGKSLTLKGKGN